MFKYNHKWKYTNPLNIPNTATKNRTIHCQPQTVNRQPQYISTIHVVLTKSMQAEYVKNISHKTLQSNHNTLLTVNRKPLTKKSPSIIY